MTEEKFASGIPAHQWDRSKAQFAMDTHQPTDDGHLLVKHLRLAMDRIDAHLSELEDYAKTVTKLREQLKKEKT